MSISAYRHVSLIRFVVCSPLPSNGSRGRHRLRGPAVPHLHRYYGLIRFLATRRRPSLVALDRRLPLHVVRGRLRGFPKFLENPFEGVPRARDSGGSFEPRITVHPMLPSVDLKTSASAMNIDFGAESSRPTSLLSTLLSRQSPDERQDSLLTCPLRL